MVIRRDNTHIAVVKDDTMLKAGSNINEGAIFGIVGILNVDGNNYLGVINEIAKVGQINRANINKITAVKLLPFTVSPFFSQVCL